MAQNIHSLRHWDNSSGEQPGKERANGDHWPVSTNLHNEHHKEDHDSHHTKKSILAKVKDKALKWRHMFTKKHVNYKSTEDGIPMTFHLEDGDDDAGEEDPEYHGAPMYESERSPKFYKVKVSRHHQQAQIQTPHLQKPSMVHRQHYRDKELIQTPQSQKCSMIHPPHHQDKELGMKYSFDSQKQVELHHPSAAIKEIPIENAIPTHGVTPMMVASEMLASACINAIETMKSMISKAQLPPLVSRECNKFIHDECVCFLKYLLRKLEPGEDDRALCEIIKESVIAAQATQNGVMHNVKDKASSLLMIGFEKISGTPMPVTTNPRTVES